MTEYNDQHVQSLLGLLQEQAPGAEQQHIAAGIVREMQAHGAGTREIIRVLSGCLYDGLTFGTWPWASPKMTESGPSVPYLVKGGKTEVEI
jgi:hypothetical protein